MGVAALLHHQRRIGITLSLSSKAAEGGDCYLAKEAPITTRKISLVPS